MIRHSPSLAQAILQHSVPVRPWFVSADIGVMANSEDLWIDACLREISG